MRCLVICMMLLPAVMRAGSGVDRVMEEGAWRTTEEVFGQCLDYIWWRESRYGTDPKCKVIGKCGERGEYQIRPIFIADVKRISGYEINPYDNQSCRRGIAIWIDYYTRLAGIDCHDYKEVYELYRRGYVGYTKWKAERRHRDGK